MRFQKFAMALALTAFSISAQAQWGYGMYGGMQACGYPVDEADGASSIFDEVKEIDNQIKEVKDDLSRVKKEQRKEQSEADRYKREIELTLNSEGAGIIETHVENGYSCNSYEGIGVKGGAKGGVTEVTQDGKNIKAGDGPQQNDIGVISIGTAVELEVFRKFCPANKKDLSGKDLCAVKNLQFSDKINRSKCSTAVNGYPVASRKAEALKNQVTSLEDMLKRLRAQRSAAVKSAVEDVKEARREQTEGGICIECMTGGRTYERKTDWAGVAANVFTGLAGLYMGYKTNQMVADHNSSIGYATQPNISTMSMGFPYLLNGVYGALGGGVGYGGFGCGGTMGGGGNWNGPFGMVGPFGMGGLYNPAMGGMWGYPPGMIGPGMAGGMFMPGMGPWGMNGPWGLNPYGMGAFPGMGAMVAGGFGFPVPGYGGAYPWMGGAGMGMPMMGMPMMGGAGMGIPMMGMPMMGAPMMAGGAIPGMGIYMGGAAGFPGYGYFMNGGIGIPMMGGAGMYPGMGVPMMGAPMMGGAGMYPGMGIPMMGAPMMGAAGMGIPMMGAPMMGGYMGGAGMGMPMMGMPMMGAPMMGGAGMYPGMGGYMMGGMGMDSMGGMQMQQQMMQMQMQQYQMQMQQQQRMVENQMQRQRALMGLQQELAGLMNRIQMVQSGADSFGGTPGLYGGGFIGVGGSFGGGFGGGAFGNGVIAAPPPGLPGPLGNSRR